MFLLDREKIHLLAHRTRSWDEKCDDLLLRYQLTLLLYYSSQHVHFWRCTRFVSRPGGPPSMASGSTPARKRTHNAVVRPAAAGAGEQKRVLGADGGGAAAPLDSPSSSGWSQTPGPVTPLPPASVHSERRALEEPPHPAESPHVLQRAAAEAESLRRLATTDAESLHILQSGYAAGRRTLSRTSSMDDRDAAAADHGRMHKWSVPAAGSRVLQGRVRVSNLARACRRSCAEAFSVLASASTSGGALRLRPTVGKQNARC